MRDRLCAYRCSGGDSHHLARGLGGMALVVTSEGTAGELLVIHDGDEPIGRMHLWRRGAVVSWQGRAYEIETHDFWKHTWVLDEGQREIGRARERPHHPHQWQLAVDEPSPPVELVSGWTPEGMEIHDQGVTVGAVEPESRDGRFVARLPDGLPEPLKVLLIFIAVAADRGHLPSSIHRPRIDPGPPTTH